MLPGQTNLLIMTTLHLVTVSVLQTLPEENVRKDFSVLKDLMSPLPVLVVITVKGKERRLSLQSVILAGSVPVVLVFQGHLMESLEISARLENTAPRVLKSQSSAPRERFQTTLATAMKAIVLTALRDHIVKQKD